MKKFMFVFMVAVLSLVLSLTACEHSDGQEETNDGESTSETTTEPETEDESSTDPSETSTELHVHAYGEWITVNEATCTQSGTKERVCSCGSKESEAVATLSHNYVENICSMCQQRDPSAFVPDYPTGQANVVGTDVAFSNYTSQAGYLYFSAAGHKINKIKTDGTGLQTVYEVTAGDVFNVNVVGDWVYFYCAGTTVGKSYIAKVRTDGSGFEKIVSSVSVWEMMVVKDTVYYTTMPTNWEYRNYAKDVLPLYRVSVNGGTPQQIHDGAVENMVADATYLYFVHSNEDGEETINRVKHGSTSSSVLLSGKDVWMLSLENSKLYFFVFDMYHDEHSLASVSSSGGSYTVYGKVMQYSESMHVVGNKVYYMGSLYREDAFCEEAGLVEYDLTTKKDKLVREDYESFGFASAGDLLIFETYNYDTEKLEAFTIYYTKKNSFKEIKLS